MMYYFLVQAFEWVFDVDSKIITYKGFTFKVTAVFGHHVANTHIAACLSRETVLGTATTSGRLEMVCVYCGSRQALDLILSPG